MSTRLNELADYLAGEEEDIADYRHELWRLANWRESPEAGGVPLYGQRIATKTGETASQGGVGESKFARSTTVARRSRAPS